MTSSTGLIEEPTEIEDVVCDAVPTPPDNGTVPDHHETKSGQEDSENISDTIRAFRKASADVLPAPDAGGGVLGMEVKNPPEPKPSSFKLRPPRKMASLRSSEKSAKAFATMPDLRMNPFYSPFSGLLAHMIQQQNPHFARSYASAGDMEQSAFSHVGTDDDQCVDLIEGKMMLGSDSVASESTSVREEPRKDAAVLEKGESLQSRASSSSAARTRWTKATWYAVQEAHRRRPGHGSGTNRTVAAAYAVGDESPEGGSKKQSLRQRVHKALAVILSSKWFNGLMIAITVYALFVPDFYFIAASSPSGDSVLFALTFAIFLLFLFELLVKSVATEGYRFSQFFWLDLFAVLSFVPDAAWLLSNRDILAEVNDLSIARASRSARVAVRVARIARVGRLLLRIRFKDHTVPLPDHTSPLSAVSPAAAHEEAHNVANNVTFHPSTGSSPPLDSAGGFDSPNPAGSYGDHAGSCNSLNARVTKAPKVKSRFGKDLEERSIKAIIFAVIAMLVLGLVMDFATTPPDTTSLATEVEFVVNAYHDFGGDQGGVQFQRMLRTLVHGQEDRGTPVLFLRIGDVVPYGSEEAVGEVRAYPKEVISAYWADLGEVGRDIEVHLADRDRATHEYWSNIGLVIVVLVVLLSSSWGLSMMLRRQVVEPVESMIGMVQQFARDPLQPLRLHRAPVEGDLGVVQMSLIKFGLLLQLAVGFAGAKTISASLKSAESGLPIQGKIVHGFFGFCDIRRFTDITEAMQADAIKVVNGIAHYVHRAVSESRGFPNKNIGDAFLLVWRPTLNVGAVETAEMALRSFVRIIIEVDRSRVLRRWILSEKVQAPNPGLRLKMGFGLHFGWAVEGAIGSPLKIDASYLSPHVNMASRLEAATKHYRVQLLISEDVFNLLSESVQHRCRLVDRVTVKGSRKPISLYTYDIPRLQSLGGSLPDNVNVTDTNLSCEEFFGLVEPRIKGSMREAHSNAIEAYLGGPAGEQADWSKAESLLEECLLMDPDDGPSRAVLDYMRARRGDERKTPHELGWDGVRSLDEK